MRDAAPCPGLPKRSVHVWARYCDHCQAWRVELDVYSEAGNGVDVEIREAHNLGPFDGPAQAEALAHALAAAGIEHVSQQAQRSPRNAV